MDLSQLLSEQKLAVVKIRRELHTIPELGFKEIKTSQYVADYLANQGLAVTRNIGGTGVVGLMDSGRPGPCLLIRADMDALAISENTGLDFASTHEGCMHACGHDGHMAMALAAASILNNIKDEFTGSVKFVFQPAEEGPGGAKPMIEDGVMSNPKVDYVFGVHLWPELPLGTIGITEGIIMAALDRFDVTVRGKGSHGAMPHQSVDALEIGTQVVGALQRIVSRKMDPRSPSVVTVGEFHAGNNYNVITDKAYLAGTTRTYDRQVWNSWPKRLETVVSGVCSSMGAEYDFSYHHGYPPLENDAGMVDVARACAKQVVGDENVVGQEPTMGGEDMAFFLEQAPGCFAFLGVGEEGSTSLHSSTFVFDEDVMLAGIHFYCRLVLQLLGNG